MKYKPEVRSADNVILNPGVTNCIFFARDTLVSSVLSPHSSAS